MGLRVKQNYKKRTPTGIYVEHSYAPPGEKRQTKNYDTGERVESRFLVDQIIIDDHPDSDEINASIDMTKVNIGDAIRRCKLQGLEPNVENVALYYVNKSASSGVPINDYFIPWLRDEEDFGGAGAYRMSQGMIKGIEKYQIENGPLNFNDLDISFVQEYTRGMLSGKYSVSKKGLVNNTMSQYLNRLILFCNWASNKNLMTSIEYHKFHRWFKKRHKIVSKELVPLELEEIKLIYENRNSSAYNGEPIEKLESLVLKMFLVGILTSSRISDICKLKWANIKNGTMSLRQKKTRKSVSLKLSPPAIELFNELRYKSDGMGFVFKKGNFRHNEYLKKVLKKLEINREVIQYYSKGTEMIERVVPFYEYVGTHCARGTYASQYVDKNGMAGLQKIMGHASQNTTFRYVKPVTEKEEERQANLFTF